LTERIRQPNRTVVNADRAAALLDAVRRRVLRGDASHADLKAQVFAAFQAFFTELSQPTTQHRPLLTLDLRDPDRYADMVSSIKHDIEAAGHDADNLSKSITSTFNYAQVAADRAQLSLRKATSKSQDLQHLSDSFAESMIVAGDDFADLSRIDQDASLEVPMIDSPVGQDAATLRREDSQNVLEDPNVVIKVLSKFQIYEGKFFAREGEARPEGGRFHFTGTDNSLQTDANVPGAPPDLIKRFSSWRADTMLPGKIQTPEGEKERADTTASDMLRWINASWTGSPFSQSELDMLVNNYHIDMGMDMGNALINPVPRRATTDRGATLDEKRRARALMLDGNPDTFWECEYVINTSEELGTGSQQTAKDPGGQSSNKPTVEEVMTTGNFGDEDKPPALKGDTGVQMTLSELTQLISSPTVDRMDLDCTILVELPEAKVINFITLAPHNFSDATWLEVVDVSTSEDGHEFEPLEGLHDGTYENILTDDINSELTNDEVSLTLAPNKYEYSGKGMWTFPPRQVKFFRIKLVQKTPIPAPYDVLAVELSATFTSTHVSTNSWGLF